MGAAGSVKETIANASDEDMKATIAALPEEKVAAIKAALAAADKPKEGAKTYEIVFVRHGESEWNLKNLFCGWYDASLSEAGEKEAKSGGAAIKEAGLKFDQAFTSKLKRAQNTLAFILEESEQKDCPVEQTWRLNERHYGDLTGANKAEAVEKHGADQVQIWRRSYDTPPPAMSEENEYFKSIVEDPKYEGQLTAADFPKCESLEMTIARTLPFWEETIVPAVKAGKKVIVAAHGNSLRGLVMHLDSMSKEAIMDLNLPTGIPFKYVLDENMKPVESMKFLGSEEAVAKAIEAVKAQTGGGKK